MDFYSEPTKEQRKKASLQYLTRQIEENSMKIETAHFFYRLDIDYSCTLEQFENELKEYKTIKN